jgi:hypothetical protein
VVNDLCAFKGKTTLEEPPRTPVRKKPAAKQSARAVKAAVRRA